MNLKNAARALAPIVVGAAMGSALISAATAARAEGRFLDWRYVGTYKSLDQCQNVGRGLVARSQARKFTCDNAYTPQGVPVLELYLR